MDFNVCRHLAAAIQLGFPAAPLPEFPCAPSQSLSPQGNLYSCTDSHQCIFPILVLHINKTIQHILPSNHLLGACYMPGSVPGSGDTILTRQKKSQPLWTLGAAQKEEINTVGGSRMMKVGECGRRRKDEAEGKRGAQNGDGVWVEWSEGGKKTAAQKPEKESSKRRE